MTNPERQERQMKEIRRLILAIPFFVAGVLTLLGSVGNQLGLNQKHIAGYAFLFGTPWGWLIDHLWFGTISNRWINQVVSYVVVLWIPALLYSLCMWCLFVGFSSVARHLPSKLHR